MEDDTLLVTNKNYSAIPASGFNISFQSHVDWKGLVDLPGAIYLNQNDVDCSVAKICNEQEEYRFQFPRDTIVYIQVDTYKSLKGANQTCIGDHVVEDWQELFLPNMIMVIQFHLSRSNRICFYDTVSLV